MKNKLRLTCPGSEYPVKDRIEGLMNGCFEWVYSDPIKNLLSLYGGENLASALGKDRIHDIEMLHEFVKIWDFRGGKERWTVEDEEFVLDNQDYIMTQAERLGLVDVVVPQIEPDYILPLGGARKSNIVRPKMARKVIDLYNYKDKTIVALSGTRPIADAERPYVNEYAPNAMTEYDAISVGLEKAFDVVDYTEETEENDNINLCSAVRKYKDTYVGSSIFSLAAPSSDSNRRANSYDTFKFFLKYFNGCKGKKLLLVTSCIYVPFQYLKFMRLSIEGGFEVDCIGSDVVDSAGMSKPSNYLQETKSTIDAIYGLCNELVKNK